MEEEEEELGISSACLTDAACYLAESAVSTLAVAYGAPGADRHTTLHHALSMLNLDYAQHQYLSSTREQ